MLQNITVVPCALEIVSRTTCTLYKVNVYVVFVTATLAYKQCCSVQCILPVRMLSGNLHREPSDRATV